MIAKLTLLSLTALSLLGQEPQPVDPVATCAGKHCGEVAPSKPMPSVEQLQAKIASLEAQLIELRLTFQYEQQVCAIPDMMRARLASAEAKAKAEAVKPPKP